jgi:septal ring factor EnvC (AmiA/AmiB activator)
VQGRLVARYGQAAWRNGPKEGFAWTAGPGAPVLAPVSGLIDYAGPLKDYGVVLILKAQGAYHLVLTGLGATDAVAGRAVAAGEPVGRMAEDAEGSRTLYLEVRRGSATLDPAHWFKALSGGPDETRTVQ